MINDFNTSLQQLNNLSKCTAILGKRGYITFSNTQNREFVLGLESFLRIFEDIKENISEFISLHTYLEDSWRAIARFFNDVPGKTMVGVQTKPSFVILSKINTIANSLEDYKDDVMVISEETITKTIEYLKGILSIFIPDEVIDKNENQVIKSNNNLRKIISEAFIYCLDIYGEKKLLHNYRLKETQIEGRSYIGLMLPEYFLRENFIGLFNSLQTDESLSSSGTPRYINNPFKVLDSDNAYFTSQWNDADNGRGLNLSNFNKLLYDISEGTLAIVKEGDVYNFIKTNKGKYYNKNVVFFGAPGTGKSYEVKEIVKNVPEENFKRVTFHPEYDYNSFVGGYKPISVKDAEGNKTDIEYRFEPQVFSEMYVKAWQNENVEYFLIIEEINRGNCAEIFGDIFQLLDRNPDYKVSPSSDLLEYLKEELGENADGIKNDKMIMPANLTLLATMNTSDQSLFPMDSAFKRRWKWEYVPIQNPLDENDNTSDSFVFTIKIDEEKEIRWIDFMVEINKHISQPHIGMDKCLGNYFIQPDEGNVIELKDFIHKVIFYLWNDVFKDEENQIFGKDITYQSFFPVETNGKTELLKILEYLQINLVVSEQQTQQLQEQEGTEE